MNEVTELVEVIKEAIEANKNVTIKKTSEVEVYIDDNFEGTYFFYRRELFNALQTENLSDKVNWE